MYVVLIAPGLGFVGQAQKQIMYFDHMGGAFMIKYFICIFMLLAFCLPVMADNQDRDNIKSAYDLGREYQKEQGNKNRLQAFIDNDHQKRIIRKLSRLKEKTPSCDKAFQLGKHYQEEQDNTPVVKRVLDNDNQKLIKEELEELKDAEKKK